MVDLLLIEWVTKMKPGSNSVEDHPQLSNDKHPVDGALVGAGSLWPLAMLPGPCLTHKWHQTHLQLQLSEQSF